MSSEAPPALTRFEFTSGLARGSHLALYPRCLVHRGESQLETLPLAAIASLRVAFLRDAGKLRWGVVLVVVALLLLAVAGPLGSLAGQSAADMASAGTQGVARALYGLFRFLEGVAAVLPAAALACALGGAALAIYGWRGTTTLTLTLGGAERIYRVRGRDTLLLDFAEMVSERLAALAR
jgi:sugar phosphate permease